MVDVVNSATRARMMSGIRSTDTLPERRVRQALHHSGFRFRLHVRNLPGKPDLVLPKYRAILFVHGCFWHRHKGCPQATTPASNAEFWLNKLEANVARDVRDVSALRSLGWRVGTVWECSVRIMPDQELAATIGAWLRSKSDSFELGNF